MNTYEPIIGLEIHVELATVSKMFCGCKNDPFFASHPNIYTCPVCLGMPGGLPVPNKKAVEWTILLGHALGCKISPESKFDRKNYFYPDLPKGYQITQYDQPLAIDGKLGNIQIRRVHLEEDTGKLIHATVEGKRVSLVDFNRSGVPLVEIVTEPDFRTVEEVDQFLKKLQQIIRYLGISNADLEKGSMRLEPSISVRLSESTKLPEYRVEIKNINSFKFVKEAIEAESMRQMHDPKERYQATRRYDEKTRTTVLMRAKEEAQDYRYFPEPDIPPMRFEKTYIEELRDRLPELPDAKYARFMKMYSLGDQDSGLLTETRKLADYFEECIKITKKIGLVDKISVKRIANWLINKRPDMETVLPAKFIEEIRNVVTVVELPSEEITGAIAIVLETKKQAVEDYKNGKEQALMFLLGQVIKKLKGKGDKQIIAEKLKEKIASYGR